MAENMYYGDGGGMGLGSMAFHIGMPIGMIMANNRMGRWMMGVKGPMSRAAKRRAGQMSRSAWGAFFEKGHGWDLSSRFQSARGAVGEAWGVKKFSHLEPIMDLQMSTTWRAPGPQFHAKTVPVRNLGLKQTGSRVVTKTVTGGIGRTAAALARPVVGVGAAYFTWGWLLPIAAEGLVGGFNELARLGEKWRRGTPETSVGFREMALRERAFTMRQASQMAIHTSQMGVRASLGSEANFLHS
jgi:hypothetical protein